MLQSATTHAVHEVLVARHEGALDDFEGSTVNLAW
eukprot:COSAG02_NODE_6824_length_3341_cov_32.448489_2_plen_35_part_00